MALAKKPFVVLDAEILSSSVWSETATVRLVWITLLILCDTEGNVGASVPGIASAAGIPLPDAEDALRRLQEPDPYSRTKANDGRRLEVTERGWRVLNFTAHLDRLSSERTRARDRMWRHRQRKKEKRVTRKQRHETTSNDATTTEQRQSLQGVGNREKGIGNREQTEERNNQSTTRAENRQPQGKANPWITNTADRLRWEDDALRLVREIREARRVKGSGETDDGAAIMATAAHYDGAPPGRQKTNPANMSDDRLVNTVLDLLATLKAEQEKSGESEASGGAVDVSLAPELASEFVAWRVMQNNTETLGQALVRWFGIRGIPFGKPLQVAISQHVHRLLPDWASA